MISGPLSELKGILSEAEPIERGEQFPDPGVGMGDDGGVDALRLFGEVGKLFEVLGLRIMGRVRLVNPKVDKKWLTGCAAFFDERDRAGHVFVDRHLRAGAVERPVLIVSIFQWQRSVGDHDVGEVPFSEMSGAIAGGLQEAGEEHGLGAQPIGHIALHVARDRRKVPVDAVAGGKLAGEEGGPARRAHGAGDRKLAKVGALGRQAVKLRRFEPRMAMRP